MNRELLLLFTLNSKTKNPDGLFQEIVKEDNLDYPYYFTKGFRQIFWKVFSKIFERQLNITVTLFGAVYKIQSVTVLESDAYSDVNKVEGTNYFIVFHVFGVGVGADDHIQTEHTDGAHRKKLSSVIRRGMDQQQMTEAHFFNFLIDKTKQHAGFDIRNYYTHNNPDLIGGNFYNVNDSGRIRQQIIYLTTLYHFGKLVYWRITRHQVSLEISRFGNSKEIIERIGDIKLQVLNLKRFFDVKNVSNTPAVKVYNTDLRDRLKIGGLYSNAKEIQVAITEAVDYLDKLNTYNTNRSVRQLLNVTTFLALPFTIISALMAINIKATILNEPQNTAIFTNSLFLVILLASFLFPYAVYQLTALISTLRKNYTTTKKSAKKRAAYPSGGYRLR